MSRGRKVVMERFDEARAREIANIIGPSSAVALALDQMERRRADGEDVYLWLCGGSILVGPVPGETSSLTGR